MINRNDWNLILINYINPIPSDFVIYLEKIYNEYENSYYYIDKKILNELKTMLNDSKKDNICLSIFSGYRDINNQINLVNNSIKKKIRNGLNIKDARDLCFETLSIPGFSEHHTGLAVDLYSNIDCIKGEIEFENTNAFCWLKYNSYKYGFILRYPKGKENITNIAYEPWHYRYVGKDVAQIIYSKNLCLEEFIEKYT